MGIGRVTSTNNSMAVMQMTPADFKDQKSKNIQNEITNTQQQMQKLSSEEELSANEKTNERKKLQQKLSSLNTELKQHQEELRRSYKREIMVAELQEDIRPAKEDESEDKTQTEKTSDNTADEKSQPAGEQQTPQPGTVITQDSDGVVVLKEALNMDNPRAADTENKQTPESRAKEIFTEEETIPTDNDTVADAGLSGKEMQGMISASSSLQQTGFQGTIITKTSDGIAILKGEIKQDEKRDVDTERKQAELEKLEKQEQRAMYFQFSLLGDANKAMKAATETSESAKESPAAAEKNAYISALNLSQEAQASQQKFYVSVS